MITTMLLQRALNCATGFFSYKMQTDNPFSLVVQKCQPLHSTAFCQFTQEDRNLTRKILLFPLAPGADVKTTILSWLSSCQGAHTGYEALSIPLGCPQQDYLISVKTRLIEEGITRLPFTKDSGGSY